MHGGIALQTLDHIKRESAIYVTFAPTIYYQIIDNFLYAYKDAIWE